MPTTIPAPISSTMPALRALARMRPRRAPHRTVLRLAPILVLAAAGALALLASQPPAASATGGDATACAIPDAPCELLSP